MPVVAIRPLFVALTFAFATACARASDPQPRMPDAPAASPARWIASWAASPQAADPDDPPLALEAQTVRQVMHLSLGGSRVRVRLSNAYGTTALHIAAAHVAIHREAASIATGSDRPITFGGASDVLIPPGALVVSDPVSLAASPSSKIAVSLFAPAAVRATTVHAAAAQTAYVSAAGNFCGAENLDAPRATRSWYFVSGIEVEASPSAATIVAFGDSIIDGNGSTRDANHRFTDFLAARLGATPRAPPRAVINQGIAGNRLLGDLVGQNALARIDRDVFAQVGAKYVIVLLGANDIGAHEPDENVTVEALIAGHRQIILRAHAAGLRAIGATVTPFEGATFQGFDTPAGEAKRQGLNHWIRTSGEYDAVVDFDRATRDPTHPTRLLPAFASNDKIHPNDAGYEAMANAVDLAIFADER